MKLKLSQDKTLERLDGHAEEDRNIEYVNLGSPLIEYGIKNLIAAHEFVLNSSLIMGDFDTPIVVRAKNVGEGNNAFGNLLKELERYYKKGSAPLLGMLSLFNGNKIKASHRLFEDNIDPDVVNEELRGYVRGKPVTKIMQALASENTKLVEGMINKLGEFGYNVIGPADEVELEKQARGTL